MVVTLFGLSTERYYEAQLGSDQHMCYLMGTLLAYLHQNDSNGKAYTQVVAMCLVYR